MAQDLERWAQQVIDRYSARIERMLGLHGMDVTFELSDDVDIADANADTGVIRLNPEWFRKHPNDTGAIAHEYAHIVSRFADGTSDAKTEAVADAVRAKLGLDNDGTWKPSREAERFVGMEPGAFRRAVGRSAETTETAQQQLADMAAGGVTDISGDNVNGPTGHTSGNDGGGGGGGFEFDPNDQNNDDIDDKAQSRRNAVSAYRGIITGFGMVLSDNLVQLIQQGADKGWSEQRFLNFLRETPEYNQEFAGIFAKDGSMKMTEAQYLANVQQYQDSAAASGINLSKRQQSFLFRNNVSPSEFGDRVEGLGRLKRDGALMSAFRKELIQAGVAKPGEVDRGNLFRFIMGEGNKDWYDLWQDTVTRNSAQLAGLQFKKGRDAYNNFGQQLIERISGRGLSESEMAQGFTFMEEQTREGGVLPLAEAELFGVNKGAVARAAFGGRKGGAHIARERIARASAQAEGFRQGQRANQQVYADATGNVQTATGKSKKAQSQG